MKLNKKVKERWQNVIMYIGATLSQQEDATIDEGKKLSNEMYEWLMSTYSLTQKKRKPNKTGLPRQRAERL